jgi:hypothetical protein
MEDHESVEVDEVGSDGSRTSTLSRGFEEVLPRPWVLTQRPLLLEKQFMDEASRRGLRLFRTEALESLHRLDLLVPLLRYDRPIRRLRATVRRSEPWMRWGLLHQSPPIYPFDLVEEIHAGRVVLTRSVPVRAWRDRDRIEGDVHFLAREFLYSPYQLLLIPTVREGLESRNALKARTLPTAWVDGVLKRARLASAENDRHVVLLTALEPIYYPAITAHTRIPGGTGSFEDYDAFARTFDPIELLRWLGWDAAELQKLAEALLWRAHFIDPLKNWHELVALVHPDKWARLEGDALLAVDLRVAAEMILRFLEDLAERGAAPALPDIPRRAFHPLGERLRPDRDDLDSVLNDYGLSPHPAVLMVVEGPTEQDLLPRVMRLLGIPVRDSFIRIVQLGGVTKQIELLARYIAPPLRRLDGQAADMLRPPLRVYVVMDAEGGYKTASQRSERKQDWVTHIWNMLEPEFRTTAAREDLKQMVDVTTWDPTAKDIEYAHFTPRQLARAILRGGRAPSDQTIDGLEASIRGLKTGGASVDKVWKQWPEPRPDMPTLWAELWPVLERRVERAKNAATLDRIPVCRVLFEAYDRAVRHRRHVVMRVG